MGDLGTLSEHDVIEEVEPKVPKFLNPFLKVLDFGIRPSPIYHRDLAKQSPNITLNIHKALAGKRKLWLLGALGISMQVVALVIPASMTYYWKEKLGDRPVQNYAYPLHLAGSCVLFIGVALCSHVVEATTVEQTFRLKRPYLVKTIFRLQMACKMGDQNFGSYILINETQDHQIRTSRISSGSKVSNLQFPLDAEQTEAIQDVCVRRAYQDARKKKVIRLGVLLSLSGFICQFVGPRALHWSATITQLAITLIMTMMRAQVRRGISLEPTFIRLPWTDLHQAALSLGNACLSHWPESQEDWPRKDLHVLKLFQSNLHDFGVNSVEIKRCQREIIPKVISLQDPRIELEHKLSNFTPSGRVNMQTMGRRITRLVKEFFQCLISLDMYGRIGDWPRYHWQHLIESDPASDIAHSYSGLILSFYMDDEFEIIWDGDQCRLDALLRLWDDSENYNGDSEFLTEGQLLYIHSGTRKKLESEVESYASWTGKSPRFSDRLPITLVQGLNHHLIQDVIRSLG